MLSCAGTFLPSAFCCALSHRGLGSRIPAGIPTGPGQLLMTQVPFLELPAALPGSLLGGWCCCAGNGQSSPGLETWSCPDPTGSSGISPSTGLAWGTVFTPVLAKPRKPAPADWRYRNSPRGHRGVGRGQTLSPLHCGMLLSWAKHPGETSSSSSSHCPSPAAAAGQEPSHSSFPSSLEER